MRERSSNLSRMVGASLFVAGCCVGAGMLGLPVVSGPYGLPPTLIMFLAGSLYMLVSGLFLSNIFIEEHELGREHHHLLSLSESFLGKQGRRITWLLFGFLFYAVLTAYTIGLANLLTEITSLSTPVAALIATAAGCSVVTKGTKAVDWANRWCFFILLAIYVVLLALAYPQIDISRLQRSEWSLLACTALPVITFSFGYHNLIPTLIRYVGADRRRIFWSILIGVMIPLIIYVLWEVAIFGIVPFNSPLEWKQSINSGEMITQVLAESIGASYLTEVVTLFAFFAVATSYLTVGVSMADFLQDRRKQYPTASRLIYALIALLPPFFIGISYPHLFLAALGYSGGVLSMLLFGMLPALFRIVRPSLGAQQSRGKWRKEKALITFLLLGGLFIMCIELQYRI